MSGHLSGIVVQGATEIKGAARLFWGEVLFYETCRLM